MRPGFLGRERRHTSSDVLASRGHMEQKDPNHDAHKSPVGCASRVLECPKPHHDPLATIGLWLSAYPHLHVSVESHPYRDRNQNVESYRQYRHRTVPSRMSGNPSYHLPAQFFRQSSFQRQALKQSNRVYVHSEHQIPKVLADPCGWEFDSYSTGIDSRLQMSVEVDLFARIAPTTASRSGSGNRTGQAPATTRGR